MSGKTNKPKSSDIVIQGVSEQSITVQVGEEVTEIHNKLDDLRALMEKLQAQTFQTADKIYNIRNINNANFDFVVGQSASDKSLPADLAHNLITDRNRWTQSLQRELLKRNVAVGNRPMDIIQHYGWLIEEFLRKMLTKEGQEYNLRALSFMTEAWQSSLRYLCYIQIAQFLKMDGKPPNLVLADFIRMQANPTKEESAAAERDFDYLNLLLVATDSLPSSDAFTPEIGAFVAELSDTKTELYSLALFLEQQRRRLLNNDITVDDQFPALLDEYLTGLVYWLRKLAFLVNYRLVSIKDVNLSYRLGTPQNFVHLYGELHGMYSQAFSIGEDYDTKIIEGVFTYNQSVLLFKGSNVDACLDNIGDPGAYLSLSPLVIDQSVFMEKNTQTPEIYYYTGYNGRQYDFAQYKNELAFGDRRLPSNKTLSVRMQNNRQPMLDELFEQLEQVFKPFKKATP